MQQVKDNIKTVSNFLARNATYQIPASERTGEHKYPETTAEWKQYDDLAEIYLRKFEEMELKVYHIDYEEQTFSICLGSPKIHGRRVMRLPELSLEFKVNSNTPKVSFKLSNYKGQYEELRRMYYYATGHDVGESTNSAMHPHISSDGIPCLGDFSQPWATTLQTNDLPMLINVAKSFINNWTRRDAYWNINDVQRCWQDYVKYGGIVFKDFLAYYMVLQGMENYGRDRGNYRGRRLGLTQVRYISNSRDLLAQAESLEMDFLDVWASSVVQTNYVQHIKDIKDGCWDKIKRGMSMWCSNSAAIQSRVGSEIKLYIKHHSNLQRIMEDVMFGTNYCEQGIDENRSTPDSYFNMFYEGITYHVNEIMSDTVTIQDAQLLNKLRLDILRDEPTQMLKVYLEPKYVYETIGSYWTREWYSDHRSRSRAFMHWIRMLVNHYPSAFEGKIDSKDLDMFVKDVYEVRYGENKVDAQEAYVIIGEMLYHLLGSIFGNVSLNGSMPGYNREEVRNVMSQIIMNESIDLIENHYKSKLERIKDGRIKYARVNGSNIGRDDEQNQLSASPV